MVEKYFHQIITALIVVNIISALIAFLIGFQSNFPDWLTYWNMSKSLELGQFSSWYFLEEYYPETIRTPGYPIFLLISRSIIDSTLFIKIIQLFLYFCSLALAYKLLNHICRNKSASIIFLSLCSINIQIPYYSGLISTEAITIFLVLLYAYILVTKQIALKNALLLGIIGGTIFLMRPAFLFFPFILGAYSLLFNKLSLRFNSIHILIFCLTLIPFSIWNLNNHGVLKVTPIEGASSIAHMGFWNFKLPIDYREDFQYNAVILEDLTSPIDLTKNERHLNKIKYEENWKTLIEQNQHLLNEKDIKSLNIMKSSNPGIFPIYNSEYTISRENKLRDLLFKDIAEEPIFYVKTRIYTFFRVYFTGLNIKSLKSANSLEGSLKVYYPFVVTFSCILLGMLISLTYYVMKKGKTPNGYDYLLLLVLYHGIVAMPFAVQGRYTVPIHFCILILLSIVLSNINFKKAIS